MIVLVATLELFLGHQDRFASDLGESWRFKGEVAERSGAAPNVLCFGDSMVEFGVVPRVIENRAGGNVYNFALHAGHPSASYFLFRRVLQTRGKPRALVVDMMPHQLAMSPSHPSFQRAWAEMATPGECLDLAWHVRDAEWIGRVALAKVLASFKARPEIRTWLTAAARGKDYSAKHAIRALRRNWEVNLGAQIMPGDRHQPQSTSPQRLFPEDGQYDPVTVAYVRRFLRLAESKGVATFWLLPPLSPDIRDVLGSRGADSPYTSFVRSLQAEFPGLTVVDGRHSDYGHELFIDAVHLNRRGASVLSADLGDVLAGSPSGVRWIELPAFRELPERAPIEDLNGSLIALDLRRGAVSR